MMNRMKVIEEASGATGAKRVTDEATEASRTTSLTASPPHPWLCSAAAALQLARQALPELAQAAACRTASGQTAVTTMNAAGAGGAAAVGPPSNPLVTPLLTDMYQITMAYSYCEPPPRDSSSHDL